MMHKQLSLWKMNFSKNQPYPKLTEHLDIVKYRNNSEQLSQPRDAVIYENLRIFRFYKSEQRIYFVKPQARFARLGFYLD